MRKVAKLTSLLLITVILSIGVTAAYAAPDQQAEQTIVELAKADGRFSILVEYLGTAELVDTLQNEGPFTVFAPTDEAFAALPETVQDQFFNEATSLRDILLYHVVPGRVTSGDLPVDGELETSAAEMINYTVVDGVPKINEATIIQADIEASNGIIHVIDQVLIPPSEQVAMEMAEPGEAEAPAAEEMPAEEETVTPDEMAVGPTETACFAEYTVQAQDWLSKVAERYYGDPLEYIIIFEATNLAAQTDITFDPILDPNVIEIGQVLCIPAAEGVEETGDTGTMDTGPAEMTGTAEMTPTMTMTGTDVITDDTLISPDQPDVTPTTEMTPTMETEATDETSMAPSGEELGALTDLITADERLSTLAELAAATAAVDLLAEPVSDEAEIGPPYTVFAPVNAAFEDLPEGRTVEDLMADPEMLTNLLLYHVVPGQNSAEALAELTEISTLTGESLLITTAEDGSILINGARVIEADIPADNGTLHLIDTVLQPGIVF